MNQRSGSFSFQTATLGADASALLHCLPLHLFQPEEHRIADPVEASSDALHRETKMTYRTLQTSAFDKTAQVSIYCFVLQTIYNATAAVILALIYFYTQ